MDAGEGGRLGGVEFVGVGVVKNGKLDIGGVEVPFNGYRGHVPIYVRRMIAPGQRYDGQVFEIAIAKHDGLAQEELERENQAAEAHPLGRLAYWRINDSETDDAFRLGEEITVEELQELDARIAKWQAEARELEEALNVEPRPSSS